MPHRAITNMGGYDIFRSDLQYNGLWSKPVNLGYPLNNPDDNIFFFPPREASQVICRCQAGMREPAKLIFTG
ncbi:MAG: hypothetical protein MZV63_35180 [Marinilabiliales bacterium]|nr:hypothetical protein [Marinilabiliales bacterium]